MPFLVKVTTVETFEINFTQLQELTKFRARTDDKTTIEQALALGGGDLARDAEAVILGEHALYDGSEMGNILFPADESQVARELIWKED